MKDYTGLQKKLVETLRKKGIKSEAVLSAFMKVPRHLFVDEVWRQQAYDDNALPIGNGQTISQPYIVALMTEALKLDGDEKILEIGTGSGYQAAILGQFSRRVYTVERDPGLGEKSRARLREMGFENVMFKIGDGSTGWLANSPYDRIIVTAGATRDIPESLIKQLREGGRMVVPTGDRVVQQLVVVEKKDDKCRIEDICDVVFVPLVGKEGWGQ